MSDIQVAVEVSAPTVKQTIKVVPTKCYRCKTRDATKKYVKMPFADRFHLVCDVCHAILTSGKED